MDDSYTWTDAGIMGMPQPFGENTAAICDADDFVIALCYDDQADRICAALNAAALQ